MIELPLSDFGTGILLAAVVAVLAGARSAFQKKSVDQTDEYVTSWSYRFFGLPVVIPFLAYAGMPDIEFQAFLPALAVSAFGTTLATLLMSRGFKMEELSLVAPIFALSPAVVLLTSPVIVGQFPNTAGLFGVLLITAGAYSLKAERGKLLEPLKALGRNRGVQLIFLVVLVYSVTANTDKLGLDASSGVFWAATLLASTSLLLFPVMVFRAESWKSQLRMNWKYLVPLGAISGLGVVLQMIALELVIVPYFVSIKRTSILVSVALGYLVFGDQDPRKRLFGAVLMVFGAALISVLGR